MTTIADVRQNMATILSRIGNWTCPSAYLGDQLHPYMFKISRPPFDPRMVFSNAKTMHTFTVTAYAPRAELEASEKALDALCEATGSGSVVAMLQTSSNWSATIDYAQVTQVGDAHLATWFDSAEYAALAFTVEVVW